MSMDRLFDKIKPLSTIPQLLHEPMQGFSDEIAVRPAVFTSFAWHAGVPALAIIARFPKPLADPRGQDPASLAGQLEQLHEQGTMPWPTF